MYETYKRKTKLTTKIIEYIAMNLWGVDIEKSRIAITYNKNKKDLKN